MKKMQVRRRVDDNTLFYGFNNCFVVQKESNVCNNDDDVVRDTAGHRET